MKCKLCGNECRETFGNNDNDMRCEACHDLNLNESNSMLVAVLAIFMTGMAALVGFILIYAHCKL